MLSLIAAGKMGRSGIRNGWGGKAKLSRQMDAEALERAKLKVQIMIEKGVVSVDDERAEKALTFLVAMVDNEKEDKKDRISCAKSVLDFCKTKPMTKAQVALTRPEDFLAMLVNQTP